MGGDGIEFKSVIVTIATLVAIIGTYLNLLKEPACFLLWGVANTVFIWMNGSANPVRASITGPHVVMWTGVNGL